MARKLKKELTIEEKLELEKQRELDNIKKKEYILMNQLMSLKLVIKLYMVH